MFVTIVVVMIVVSIILATRTAPVNHAFDNTRIKWLSQHLPKECHGVCTFPFFWLEYTPTFEPSKAAD
jgi:hypothetical protein